MRFLEAPPFVALGHHVLTSRRILSCGYFVVPYFMATGPSRLECALNDLTQFGIICSVIGWVYLWCYRRIMLSKQTNSHT